MKLSGKIALVTGASRGIGRSVARAFAREGAGIFLVGHQDESALQQTLRETREMGAEADGGLFDVGNYGEVRRLIKAIERRFTTLDIVVNNAGIIRATPLPEITPEQWESTIRTHLRHLLLHDRGGESFHEGSPIRKNHRRGGGGGLRGFYG